MKRMLRRLFSRDEAVSAIEMAVTLPLMFTLIFAFMELCLLCYTRTMIAERAREGTRFAMFHGATCPTATNPTCEMSATQVNTYVSSISWPNLAGGSMVVATQYYASGCGPATCSPNGCEAVGCQVQVKITYTFPITMPLVPRNSFTLTATSETTIVQ